MNLGKFSPYQLFCTFLISCLKPFSVVIETLLHQNVGERYAGVSALFAILLLGLDAEVCPASQSTLVWLVITAFAVRVVMIRVAGMRRRRRHDTSVHSRSAGTSVLHVLWSRLPKQVALWIEPFAVMLVAWIFSFFNPTMGDFLLYSGGALLAINLIRLSAAYSKELDEEDALVEQKAPRVEGLVFTPSASSQASLSTPLNDVYALQTGSRAIEAGRTGDADVEPEMNGLLALGGEPWKQ
jgi:hypothetical protein